MAGPTSSSLDQPARRLTLHVALDALDAFVDSLRVDVFQDDVETRKRQDMGDTVAHLACADNSYAFDAHAGSGMSLPRVD